MRISNEELVILSFPGPDRSIRLEDFQAGRAVSRRYRNRRIGEFLKELDLTEGRSTGIPKILKVMAANGSPPPLFESDEDRLSFVIQLPCHPLARPVPPEVAGEVAPEVTPEVTPEVAPEVVRVVLALQEELSRTGLQQALDLKDEKHFRKAYLLPALASGLVEMTRPETPRSSKQRYRRTRLGQRWLETYQSNGAG
ncbi:Fic family protein [Serpentinimonas maccroryi]|uniref:Fic family protein n=1 Tax=Serpentinimonas maccroryi TaxID=1458426 RepID=UPI002033C85E